MSTLPEGVPPLRSLYVYAAGACNLACKHCYISPPFLRPHEAEANPKKFVDVDLFEKVVVEALPLGLQSVKFTGGEPLLHPRFRDLVTVAVRHDLSIVVETNGTLVDAPLAAFLKESGKVCFVSVSLDGPGAQTHDELRGVRGSFDRAVAGIHHLVAAGIRPQVICTLHTGNVAAMRDTIALAASLGASSVKFNHVQKMGRGEAMARDRGLSTREILGLYAEVEDPGRPPAPLPVHFDIPFAFRPMRALLRSAGNRCAVLNILGLLSGGELGLCGAAQFEPALAWGRAEDGVRSAWCDAPGVKRLREHVPLGLTGACAECLHRDFCMGSCVAETFHRSGEVAVSNAFCQDAAELGLFPTSRLRRAAALSTLSSRGV